jgi:hypothetical protein
VDTVDEAVEDEKSRCHWTAEAPKSIWRRAVAIVATTQHQCPQSSPPSTTSRITNLLDALSEIYRSIRDIMKDYAVLQLCNPLRLRVQPEPFDL